MSPLGDGTPPSDHWNVGRVVVLIQQKMSPSTAATLAWSMLHRPEIIRAGRFPMLEKSRGYVHRWPTVALHQHDYEGRIHIGEGQYELRSGDLTLTPAEINSHYHLPRSGYHLCIHFRHTAAAEHNETHALKLPLHLRLGTGSGAIRQRIWWITDLHRRAGHADPRKRALALAAASAGMQELMLTLALLAPEEMPAEPVSSRVEKAMLTLLELIESRLKDALTVPALAEESGLSQNYLARLFRRRYGVAVPHFILLRRMDLARHLLTTSEASVKEIAHEVGLPDMQHFNKQFRRLAGTSPSAYRRAHVAAARD